MLEVLTTGQLKEMVLAISDTIIGSVDVLTEADRNIGDGDHGLGMSRGFEGVRDVVASTQFASARDLLKAVGDTLIDRMGGASGVVFGLMFRGGARSLGDGECVTARDLVGYFERSIDEIMKRGGAQLGDKTMLDALVPAVAALKQAAEHCPDIVPALSAAAQAAEAGKERTQEFVARFGKASTMGERSLGYPDAGAMSVTLIFQTMRDWAASQAELRATSKQS